MVQELSRCRVVAALKLKFGVVEQSINLCSPNLVLVLQKLQVVGFVLLQLLDGAFIAQEGHNALGLRLQ